MDILCFTYSLVANVGDDEEEFEWIWNIKCIERIKIFIWLLVKGKLLTNVERVKKKMTTDGACPICEEKEETISHLLRGSKYAYECWKRRSNPTTFRSKSLSQFNVWIKENYTKYMGFRDGTIWATKFFYMLCGLLKTHNDLIFNRARKDAQEIISKATYMVKEAGAKWYPKE